VRDIVTNPQAQFDASVTLHKRYRTPAVLSVMDLSVEAEAFGCPIRMADDEIPTTVDRAVANLDQAKALAVPKPGDKRTNIYLETVVKLRRLPDEPLVLAECIGPFSLAGRLVGLSEACELTLTDPDLMHLLLEKSTELLTAYVKVLKAAGADGSIMGRAGGGLLSPRGFAAFSSACVRRVAAAIDDDQFTVIFHNCAAKLVHLSAALETGAKVYHFGAPMDVVGALARVPADVVLCGNLDPVAVFLQSTPADVAAKTAQLLAAARAHRNFVISSGCDVPPASLLANLDTFYETVARH
jgi:uroporphyrinogen decarboxylase